MSVKNEYATVLDIDKDGWLLLEFKNWHKGNNGHYMYPDKCKRNNCFFVTEDSTIFKSLNVRPSDMPNAYDVISSLYESEDLDWAMNMASDISKSIIIPGQYYRINGKIAHIPFDDTIDIYIKAVDDEVIVYDVISVGGTNWSAKHEKVDIKRISKVLGMKEGQFIENYLKEDQDGDFVLQQLPCPFLGNDNHCGIYEDRPSGCRRFPYTDEDVLVKRIPLTLKNTTFCPITYVVIERLMEAIPKS